MMYKYFLELANTQKDAVLYVRTFSKLAWLLKSKFGLRKDAS